MPFLYFCLFLFYFILFCFVCLFLGFLFFFFLLHLGFLVAAQVLVGQSDGPGDKEEQSPGAAGAPRDRTRHQQGVKQEMCFVKKKGPSGKRHSRHSSFKKKGHLNVVSTTCHKQLPQTLATPVKADAQPAKALLCL